MSYCVKLKKYKYFELVFDPFAALCEHFMAGKSRVEIGGMRTKRKIIKDLAEEERHQAGGVEEERA